MSHQASANPSLEAIFAIIAAAVDPEEQRKRALAEIEDEEECDPRAISDWGELFAEVVARLDEEDVEDAKVSSPASKPRSARKPRITRSIPGGTSSPGSGTKSIPGAPARPLVEGACGPRPAGKPIPQTQDALFWKVEVAKLSSEDEKTIVRIQPMELPTT